MKEVKKEQQDIEVNGKKITETELSNLQNDPTKKLKEVEPKKFKLLERLFG